jgi:5,10-methylenetetrahydromethanopterin reductase
MKLGINSSPKPGDTARMAKLVEQFGFDSLALTDSQNLQPDVWGQLALAAQATKRIQIGTGVSNSLTRDCAVSASALLALQIDSGGRAFFGVGRGGSATEKIGMGTDSPKAFKQYLQDLQNYLLGETVHVRNTASQLEWASANTFGKPSVEVAATGPKIIDIAAQHADQITFCLGASPERIGQALNAARKSAESYGREPDSLQYGAYVNCAIHPNISLAREAIRGSISVFALTNARNSAGMSDLPDNLRRAAETLKNNYRLEETGQSTALHAKLLPDDFIDWFGLVGPWESVRERFEQLKELGLDYVRVLPGSVDMPQEVAVGTLMSLSKHILPAIK